MNSRAPRRLFLYIAGLAVSEPLFTFLLVGVVFLFIFENRVMAAHFFEYLDIPALATLTAFFVASYFLELSGLFSALACVILRRGKASLGSVSVILVVLTEAMATVIMNDAAMFIAVPLAVAIARLANSDEESLVVGVALAANIGSSLTPNGNPQNIIIWIKWRIDYWSFVSSMFPYVLLWTVLLVIYVYMTGRRVYVAEAPPPISLRAREAATALLVLIADILLVEHGLWLEALALSLSAVFMLDYRIIFRIDHVLLATFALMFLFFNTLSSLIPLPSLRGIQLMITAVMLSQVISNVPAALLLSRKTVEWLPLAVGVNLGGIGTVIGSMANFIGLRLSKVTIKDFHKRELPFFAAALAATIILYIASTI